MCGIWGYYCFSKARPKKEIIENLFVENQGRGRDASGYAYVEGGKLHGYKAPIPAEKMILTKEWGALTLPRILIGHTRAATVGPASENLNNHPLSDKSGWCLVHNGGVRGYEEMEREWGYTRPAGQEVDSIGLLAAFSTSKTLEETMGKVEKLGGSAAILAISRDQPDLLIAAAETSPLHYLYDFKEDILYFSSERKDLKTSFAYQKRGFTCVTLPNEIYAVQNLKGFTILPQGVGEVFAIHLKGTFPIIQDRGWVQKYRGGNGRDTHFPIKRESPRSEFGLGLILSPEEVNWENHDMLVECPGCFVGITVRYLRGHGEFTCYRCSSPIIPPLSARINFHKKEKKILNRLLGKLDEEALTSPALEIPPDVEIGGV